MGKLLRRLFVIIVAGFVGAVVFVFLSFYGGRHGGGPVWVDESKEDFHSHILMIAGLGAVVFGGIAVYSMREMDASDEELRREEEEYQSRKKQQSRQIK